MKFLVLALCVCAASAASYGAYKPYQPARQVTKAFAKPVAAPFVAAPAAVAAAPAVIAAAPIVAAKTGYEAAKIVAAAPVSAANAVYNTGKNVYTDGKESEAAILRSDSEVSADGFNYVYETANGIAAQASGVTKKVDDAEVVVVQGSYKYIAPDGTPVEFSYVADENGYQPQGALLPVGPAIPEAIARSLEYIRANPPKPETY